MTQTQHKKVYARIPAELHKAVRIKAFEEGRSVTDVVEEYLRDYVEKNGAPAMNGDPDGPSEAQKTA